MDTSHIELLKGIEIAISTPRDYDWWMFGINAANVLFFIFISYLLNQLNKNIAKSQENLQREISQNQENLQKEIAKNQDELQKRNLKLQLFEKRIKVLECVLDTKKHLKENIIDYPLILDSFKDETLTVLLKEQYDNIKYNSVVSTMLFGSDISEKLQTLKEKIENIINKYIDSNVIYLKPEYKTFSYNDNSLRKINGKYSNCLREGKTLDEMKNEINDPLFTSIVELINLKEDYCKYIDDNNIIEKFHEYLNVHDLEK